MQSFKETNLTHLSNEFKNTFFLHEHFSQIPKKMEDSLIKAYSI